MSYKLTVKKQLKCKHCKGLGYYTFNNDNNSNFEHSHVTVEYFCNKCDGKGKIWKTVDIPLSSLKELLK